MKMEHSVEHEEDMTKVSGRKEPYLKRKGYAKSPNILKAVKNLKCLDLMARIKKSLWIRNSIKKKYNVSNSNSIQGKPKILKGDGTGPKSNLIQSEPKILKGDGTDPEKPVEPDNKPVDYGESDQFDEA